MASGSCKGSDLVLFEVKDCFNILEYKLFFFFRFFLGGGCASFDSGMASAMFVQL